MLLIMNRNCFKFEFYNHCNFFFCLGYVVTMRSLNGDWQENVPSEGSEKNVLSAPFEALNFICLSTPSLDACKFLISLFHLCFSVLKPDDYFSLFYFYL